MQKSQPVAFYSQAFSRWALGRSTYKKELMAIVHAFNKWRNYLLGRKFRIRTNHCSLKYILEQRITTMDQQRWMVKLMGFHYEIEYHPIRENKVSDALSRLQGEVSAISCLAPTWLEAVRI